MGVKMVGKTIDVQDEKTLLEFKLKRYKLMLKKANQRIKEQEQYIELLKSAKANKTLQEIQEILKNGGY